MSRKWLFLLPAALLAVVLLALFLGRPSELDRWKADMEAQGEKLTFRALGAKYSPEVAAFHRQFTGLVSRLQFQPVNPGMLDTMQLAGPGRAHVLWRQPVPDAARADISWEQFAAQMASNAPTLAALRDLLARWPPGMAWDPAAPFQSAVPNLVAARKCAQTLNGAVVDALHRGQFDAARSNLHALLALGRSFDEAGTLVERMIGVAIFGLAVNVTWEALQAPGWDEPRLADLQRRWLEHDRVVSIARTGESERAFVLAAFQHARTNDIGAGDIYSVAGIDSTNWLAEVVNDSIIRPVWRKAWSRKDELLYLQAMQPVMVALRAAATNRSWPTLRGDLQAAVAGANRPRNALDRFRYPMSLTTIPNWQKAALHLMRHETRRHLTVTALALRRWQLARGALPDRLEVLIPEFLPAPPRDCLAGGTLRYRRDGENAFRLYSTGEDGRDDGGDGDDIRWLEARP